jgi:hypothetical protein
VADVSKLGTEASTSSTLKSSVKSVTAKVNSVQKVCSSGKDPIFLEISTKPFLVSLMVQGRPVVAQVDCGADLNIMDQSYCMALVYLGLVRTLELDSEVEVVYGGGEPSRSKLGL